VVVQIRNRRSMLALLGGFRSDGGAMPRPASCAGRTPPAASSAVAWSPIGSIGGGGIYRSTWSRPSQAACAICGRAAHAGRRRGGRAAARARGWACCSARQFQSLLYESPQAPPGTTQGMMMALAAAPMMMTP
jgi:hypothetical protein